MVETEAKNLVGLTGDDERFVKRTKELFRELRRSVYQKVCAICEIDGAAEVLCEDDKKTLQELQQKWSEWYAVDLQPDKAKQLNEYQEGVVSELVERTEGLLEQFLPRCQSAIIEKLAARLPKRLADDELEELRNSAGCEVVNVVMASGLAVQEQIVVLKKMREAFVKARGENGRKKQINR